ncbi:MAG: DUF2147 domain-containing protein [Hymenobacter sp.]
MLENPDPKLRSPPAVWAMVFMNGFSYDDDNKWDNGKIYDPVTGKTYSCYMKMESANHDGSEGLHRLFPHRQARRPGRG